MTQNNISELEKELAEIFTVRKGNSTVINLISNDQLNKLLSLFTRQEEKIRKEVVEKFADDIETDFYARTGNQPNSYRDILNEVINTLLKKEIER